MNESTWMAADPHLASSLSPSQDERMRSPQNLHSQEDGESCGAGRGGAEPGLGGHPDLACGPQVARPGRTAPPARSAACAPCCLGCRQSAVSLLGPGSARRAAHGAGPDW
ncbi:Nucleolar protein 4-like [Galemys pyrenaicus]|uniref:Nucleolar protein 4-like n=1 Tax=Galemys pyrenaicus TaxID=202257 RepID=A0A8J6AN46_GALPY|nr:Nucleolar protein 4-like [Galemys pyrenaicus]